MLSLQSCNPRTPSELITYADKLSKNYLYTAAAAVITSLCVDNESIRKNPVVNQLLAVCALGTQNVNMLNQVMPYVTSPLLRSLSSAALLSAHDMHVSALKNFAVQPADSQYSGVGIVIPAGGTELLSQAWANVRSLRYTGCRLPVVIAHSNEIDAKAEARLAEELDVSLLNVCDTMPGNWRGFQIKLAAVVASCFATVILSDADILWLSNPERLLDRMRCSGAGMMLFSDIWEFYKRQHNRTSITIWLQKINGMTPEGAEVESGVVLVDKTRAGVAQCMRYMAQNYNYYFSMSFGDKDLYAIVAHHCGVSVVRPPAPRMLLVPSNVSDQMLCHSMLHYADNDSYSHIHSTLFPTGVANLERVPAPTHTCAGADVHFVRTTEFSDRGEVETVGCKSDLCTPISPLERIEPAFIAARMAVSDFCARYSCSSSESVSS